MHKIIQVRAQIPVQEKKVYAHSFLLLVIAGGRNGRDIPLGVDVDVSMSNGTVPVEHLWQLMCKFISTYNKHQTASLETHFTFLFPMAEGSSRVSFSFSFANLVTKTAAMAGIRCRDLDLTKLIPTNLYSTTAGSTPSIGHAASLHTWSGYHAT